MTPEPKSGPRWLSEPEERAWRGYRRMHALLDLQVARDLAADSGFSDADYDVLSNLSETTGHRLRLTELAGRMLWSKSRLSHHVSRMEQRGLVRRSERESDRRGADIVLTEEGWAAIEAAAPRHVESVRRLFIDVLSVEEIKVLGEIAEKIVAHLASVTHLKGER